MIQHIERKRRFFCVIDVHECTLEYEMKGADTMDIYRTFVHDDLRGRGLAGQLMESAIAFARERGLKIFPTCSYAIQFFKRHPGDAPLLAADVDPENGGSCRLPKS